jgi:NAD(P)-dependent dehydrogenase (short-subunit alcohol dehydrogenase family)
MNSAPLAGRTVAVFGGSSGIGLATAEAAHALGAASSRFSTRSSREAAARIGEAETAAVDILDAESSTSAIPSTMSCVGGRTGGRTVETLDSLLRVSTRVSSTQIPFATFRQTIPRCSRPGRRLDVPIKIRRRPVRAQRRAGALSRRVFERLLQTAAYPTADRRLPAPFRLVQRPLLPEPEASIYNDRERNDRVFSFVRFSPRTRPSTKAVTWSTMLLQTLFGSVTNF